MDFPFLTSLALSVHNLSEPETIASWKQGVQECETPDEKKFWLFSGRSGGRKMEGNGLRERETASGSLLRTGKLRGEVHQHSTAL